MAVEDVPSPRISCRSTILWPYSPAAKSAIPNTRLPVPKIYSPRFGRNEKALAFLWLCKRDAPMRQPQPQPQSQGRPSGHGTCRSFLSGELALCDRTLFKFSRTPIEAAVCFQATARCPSPATCLPSRSPCRRSAQAQLQAQLQVQLRPPSTTARSPSNHTVCMYLRGIWISPGKNWNSPGCLMVSRQRTSENGNMESPRR